MIIYICLAGTAVYLYYLWLAHRGYGNIIPPLPYTRCFISVVIAARNEADNLPELLLRLKNQNYPSDHYEVILVDDASSDGTAELAERFAEKWSNLKIIRIQDRDNALSKKKNALQQGITAAQGEIIMLTDADCLPGSNWLSSMAGGFTDNTDMVVGLSRTQYYDKPRLFSAQSFEHFDFLAMFATAGGLILSGKYFSCSGQNLAYRKSAWEKVGGFSKIKHIISGDDVNLMQLFRQAGLKISFNMSTGSFMTTASIQNWWELINQRTRWSSNTRYQLMLNPEFFIFLMSVLIITFLPWFLLFSYFSTGLVVILLRLAFEMSFLKYVFKKFKEPPESVKFYPVWFILQPLYVLIVSTSGFFGWFMWKK
ncbi:MAG: glycosyltransferase [Candidatus Cloacimonetes bacterium]|nr:glycosyltransferase [Candidatus Cloacimonadota bacterium]